MGSHGVLNLAFLLVVSFLGAVIAADRKGCIMKLGHPGNLHCCKDKHDGHEHEKKDFDPEKFKECFQPPNKPPPSCDTEICLAKKHGHLNDDGSINMESIESEVEKKMADDPDVIEAIKTKCLHGDLTDYGPPHACELMKLRHCVRLQLILACKEWDNTGPCSGIEDQVEECKSVV